MEDIDRRVGEDILYLNRGNMVKLFDALPLARNFVPDIPGGVTDGVDDFTHVVGHGADGFADSPGQRTTRITEKAEGVV